MGMGVLKEAGGCVSGPAGAASIRLRIRAWHFSASDALVLTMPKKQLSSRWPPRHACRPRRRHSQGGALLL